jgi:hypothetical protein
MVVILSGKAGAMKKLKLDLESIVVDSFGVQPKLPARTGTVAGFDVTEAGTCRGSTCGQSCPGQNTNCVCDPDTYGETWSVPSCVTGECQCYNTYGDPTCTGICCG